MGVDDWAFRKGHRYGTILVDLERHCLAGFVTERSSESLAAWLKQHPTIESSAATAPVCMPTEPDRARLKRNRWPIAGIFYTI